MLEVIGLLTSGDYHAALARLWVLTTTRARPEDDLPLNAWERATPPAERQPLVTAIHTELNDGRPIDRAAVDADPLALVIALDAFLGLGTAARGFAAEPYRIDGRDYWLIPLNLARPSAARSARQVNNPQSWFRYHRVIPAALPSGLRVELQPSRDVTDTRLREMTSPGRLRAFLGHFDDGATLEPPPTGRFFATGLSGETTRTASIERALTRASDDRADVLVLPELTVTPMQREVIKGWLLRNRAHAPALVVPGSFHEQRDGRKVNAAELLAGDGRRLFVHEKLRPFGGVDGPAEDIDAANTLRLLVTPIGSVALAICKDYCDDPGPIRDWDTLAVDWWLVPSMGDQTTIDAHARRATSLWTVVNRGVTLLANQEPAMGGAAGPFPGFAFHGRTTATRTDVTVGGDIVEIHIGTIRRVN